MANCAIRYFAIGYFAIGYFAMHHVISDQDLHAGSSRSVERRPVKLNTTIHVVEAMLDRPDP